MKQVYIGVDVGTGSARAGIFDGQGNVIAIGKQAIEMWRPRDDFAEQSSTDIWGAVVIAMRAALAQADEAFEVCGIGFTATCSMVVLDRDGQPLAINADGVDERNVIVWMDHRAKTQTQVINSVPSIVRDYVGGQVSIEMQTPKLLWIKENLPDTWVKAGHFMDLPDFLTYRATGSLSRSVCSLTCKWGYLGHENRFDGAFLQSVGLGELVDEGFRRLGTDVRGLGSVAGHLTEAAAHELGLKPGIPVGVSAIDAHAGGIGTIGAATSGTIDFNERLSLIAGTSNCHMVVSEEPRFVSGVWGPYYSALMPGMWLNEAGQSASGALIDHVIASHPASGYLTETARNSGKSVFDILHGELERMAEASPFPASLTRDTHVDPDFHGNRSPRADASLRGTITGLRLSKDVQDLARLYLATVQAIAYGTRHIVETLNAKGYGITTLFISGGFTKNPVFLSEHADACGLAIVCPEDNEAVLLGASILGATASGAFEALPQAMAAMSRAGRTIVPSAEAKRFHDAKYAVFQRMHDDQLAYRALMTAV